MYDDKEIEVIDKALVLISEIKSALANGCKHYRKSDNKPLTTLKEIITALRDKGEIEIEPR